MADSDKDFATKVFYEFTVSGSDPTTQAYDYLSQVINHLLARDDVDRVLLCGLLAQKAQYEQNAPFQIKPPVLGNPN